MTALEKRDLGAHDVVLNGKSLKAHVMLEVFHDDVDPADLSDPAVFDSPADYQAYLQRFETGDLCMVVLVVTATFVGLEGSDVLGGCEVAKPGDVDMYLTEHGMVAAALSDLQATVARTLTAFA